MTRLALHPYWLIVIALFLFPSIVPAQLQVNAVSSTPSTCANNGSITIDAVTVSPPLLFSITAGPVPAPVQTASVFHSLPAGTYTVTISDGAANTVSRNVVVDGNYLPPDLQPVNIHPFCNGGSDGQIAGNRVAGTGLAPFTWQLMVPSPVVTPPQASDTFKSLPAGDYTIRLTDACGGFRTFITTLTNPPLSNMVFFVPPRIAITGCDSAMLSMSLHADAWRFPLTCTFVTGSGSFTTRSPTIIDTSGCCGYITLEQLLPGFTYGDQVQVTITDSCGASVVSPTYTARPFSFCTQVAQYFADCDYKTSIIFNLNGGACEVPGTIGTYLKAPVSYVVTDAANAVLATGSETGFPGIGGYPIISSFTVKDLPVNNTYHIVIADSCGHTTERDFYVPAAVTPVPAISSLQIVPTACVDSAAFAFLFVENFKKEPRLVLLSGPVRMGSTKAGYAYESNYVYPDTLAPMGFGYNNYRFDMSNLSAGTYQFKLIDSCGSEVFDHITIAETEVTNLSHRFTYRKGCPGDNKLYYNIAASHGNIRIRNLTTGEEVYKYYQPQDATVFINDSVSNLASGRYELAFTYASAYGVSSPINHLPVDCKVITDTLVIEGYQTPAILINNYVQCKTNTYLELVADSSKGVAPFSYEIISGPQVFPVQSGNLFAAATPGTYTARIYDVCGNASTTGVTVSAISFPPIAERTFSCNSRQLTYGRSAYYTYRWTTPGGVTYATDTLTIDPVTPGDTGVYTIQRATDINGCRDTSYTTYHLQLKNVYTQNISLCPGRSVTVGRHSYNIAGVFTDTLVRPLLCDSVVVTRITLLPYKRDSVRYTMCPGQQYPFNGRTYSVAGVYSDTLGTATCDSIVTLLLSINLKRDSIVRSTCANMPYVFNGRQLTQPGIYRDTLPTAGCDSIVVLNLSVLPVKRNTINITICAGESFQFNGLLLTEAGVYHDTLPTATCDSMVVLNLSVTAPVIQVSANADTVVVGGSIQLQATQANQYRWEGGGVVFNNPGIANPAATPSRSGWITVHAASDPEGCPVSDSVFITVLSRATYCADAYIYMPTGFTPNGDGRNDWFRVVAQKITLKSFRIFNRWGEQVFTTNDIATGWNGRYKGERLPGSYVYMVTYTDCMGVVKMVTGTITLLL
ncbi:gliding motility-associated-like protein [Filimonas zeae]|nr:gliding motility-associated C-terminal domain-containing protein [Filimonas zeae]MDR6339314.1 gliding motility-associated-like protein [Filimonas zeae]